MRAIKFKGKCIDPKFNGKIACGSLVTFPNGASLIFEYNFGRNFKYFNVYPQTICQFTGFFDKNGNEIYEGDVLRSDEYPYSQIGANERDNYFAIVYYCEEGALFATVSVKNPESDVKNVSDGIITSVSQQKLRNFEVVGNINDPEWEQYGEWLRFGSAKY